MLNYIYMLSIGVMSFVVYKAIHRTINTISSVRIRKTLKEITVNENLINLNSKPIIEYSREISADLGKRLSKEKPFTFQRPSEFKKRGLSDALRFSLEKEKRKNPQYANAIKRRVPVKDLHQAGDLDNVSIRVYVESMLDNKIKIWDNTASYSLIMDKQYAIVGEFVIINLDKRGEKIKVNYIMVD